MLKAALFRFVLLVGSVVLMQNGFCAPDFQRDVAPILEATCLSCHNEHERKGDLDLSTRATALAFENAIIPGSPVASILLKMVSGEKPKMPKKAPPLPEEQINILRDWIANGANWPEDKVLVHNPQRDLDWWSLRPISAKVTDQTVPGDDINPVDSFIQSQLKEKGLHAVPEADPTTLIRRVTYDLTGLPPTPDEVTNFISDPNWETAVDRLLENPAFGEKFGQHWLDLARYAESHGYDKDKPRENAWPYRDYVIRSLNEDKPFSRFVEEQVAGDVLYPENSDGVIALGFLAAGPWDFIGHWEVGEGKVDGRIAKHLDRDEMVSAVFNVFQSTTVQCAQCHHHKFDPIRMEDYYRLHAVFAAVDRADRVYEGLPLEKRLEKEKLLSQINSLKVEKESLTTKITRLISAKTSGLDRRIAVLKDKYGTGSGPKPQYGYHSLISKVATSEKWVQIDLGKPRGATEIRIIPAFDNYNSIGAGFGFPVRYRVEVSHDSSFDKNVRVLLDSTTEDQPNPKRETIRISGDGNGFRFLRVTATKLVERKNDFIFALGEIEIVNEGGAENFARKANVSALDSIEQGVRWGRKNLVDGIYYREISDPSAFEELNTLEKERARIAQSLRPPEADMRLGEIEADLKRLDAELKAFPKGKLVYAAATDFPRGGRFTATTGKPRPIHLLHRGDIKSPGESMTPGVPPLWAGISPTFFEEPGWSEGDARAELAGYLTRADNPLLWRSIVNRLWQWTMGTALVESANDFGRGGTGPTNPELLDFLAERLRSDPDQSLKSILRIILTSDAYRRSSEHDSTNAAIDIGNAYFWRANRRRLTAEEYRDSLLAATGLLDRTRGGPSFKDFVIEKPQHSPHYQYHLHNPEDPASHRRTIYRFVVRSQPQPMLSTLDCADPSLSVPQRDESTTALQALTQWNHRFVETMARKFAERLAEENNPSAKQKVDFAYQLVIGRAPSTEERKLLTDHLMAHGDASFARVLFNLNHFVYVD